MSAGDDRDGRIQPDGPCVICGMSSQLPRASIVTVTPGADNGGVPISQVADSDGPTRDGSGGSVTSKAGYVRRQGQDRRHSCHGGCGAQCPPAMWGCRSCWYKLPKHLRAAIWAEYIPGQEQRMDPSEGYLNVAHEAQEFIKSRPDLFPWAAPSDRSAGSDG